MTMSADQAARRRAQLARLLPLADIQAQAGRAKLGAARRAEIESAQAVQALDAQRRETLARLDRAAGSAGGNEADAAGGAVALAAQTDRWLRWYAAQRREKLIEQARLKAACEEVARDAGRAIARHEVLCKLEQRTARTLRQARDRARDDMS
jgi:hypothetical protein